MWMALATITGGVCLAAILGAALAGFIAERLAAWRERARGRRVEAWSDDASRLRALREAGASPAVAEQIILGNKINAIKAYREATGAGLKDSKDMIERYQEALYRYEPWASPWQAPREMR